MPWEKSSKSEKCPYCGVGLWEKVDRNGDVVKEACRVCWKYHKPFGPVPEEEPVDRHEELADQEAEKKEVCEDEEEDGDSIQGSSD